MIKRISIDVEPVDLDEELFDGVHYRFRMQVGDDRLLEYKLNQGSHILSAMGEEFAFRFFMEQVTDKVAEVAFHGADN